MSGHVGFRWHTCPEVSWTSDGPWDRDKFSRDKRPWRKPWDGTVPSHAHPWFNWSHRSHGVKIFRKRPQMSTVVDFSGQMLK